MAHGPLMTKLIVQFVARVAIPEGGTLADGLKFIQDAEYRKGVLEKAESKAVEAVSLVRTAPDNPYGDDNEAIAGAILERLEERRRNGRSK